MKKKFTFILAFFVLAVLSLNAQTKKAYTTSGGEIIFSFADINNQGNETGNIMRFSPFFNLQSNLNLQCRNKQHWSR
jgi:hypothetical protein